MKRIIYKKTQRLPDWFDVAEKLGASLEQPASVLIVQVVAAGVWRLGLSFVGVLQWRELLLAQHLPYGKVSIQLSAISNIKQNETKNMYVFEKASDNVYKVAFLIVRDEKRILRGRIEQS